MIARYKDYLIEEALQNWRRKDQLSVQLPEDLELVHVIKTDDAYGIEAYWQHRFVAKQSKGEWFTLTLERVPIGWNHPIDKNPLRFKMLEHFRAQNRAHFC